MASVRRQGRFGLWLWGQIEREGLIGRLAELARTDARYPRYAGSRAVRKWLRQRTRDAFLFDALDDARLEWQVFRS